MVGRLAQNNTWDVAKLDKEFFDPDGPDTMTREEILIDYADFA